jgi:hypothetical protein
MIERIEEFVKLLINMRGIISVALLTGEEREQVERLEKEAEKRMLMGMGRGQNIGMREVMKKRYVFVCATTLEFKWPRKDLLRILYAGEVVGRDIYDKKELEELRAKGDIVMGNIVLFRNKVRHLKAKRENRELNEGFTVQILPLELPELSRYGAVAASPSTPTDLYLKKLLNIPTDDGSLGTILVGVD